MRVPARVQEIGDGGHGFGIIWENASSQDSVIQFLIAGTSAESLPLIVTNPNVCEDVNECGEDGICGIDSECQVRMTRLEITVMQ